MIGIKKERWRKCHKHHFCVRSAARAHIIKLNFLVPCPACNTLPRSSYCSQLRAKSFYRIILLKAKLLDQKRFSTRLWPQLFPARRLRRKRAGAAGDVRLSLELGRPGFSPCSKSPVNSEIRHSLLPFPYRNIGFEEGGCITDSEMLAYYEGDRQKL